MKRLVQIIVALQFMWVCNAWAQAPSQYAWVRSNSHNVSTVTWSRNQISSFIQSITDTNVSIDVGDFRFIDLLGNNKLSLIAAVDYSGRKFFNTVLIVSKTNQGSFTIQSIPTINLESLKGHILDLDRDGRARITHPRRAYPLHRRLISASSMDSNIPLGWNGL